jgi:hypothetical protein
MISLKKEKANWNGRDLEILPGGVSLLNIEWLICRVINKLD